MIFQCKRCKCEFEVNILSGNQEVGSAVCANCGYGALADKGDTKATADIQDLENNFKSF